MVSVLIDPDDDDTVRNEVANLLERSKYSNMVSALISVLNNPREKSRFRSFAMQHLGGLIPQINDESREYVLNKIRLALEDHHVEVRREALLALVRQRDSLGTETTVKWLSLEPLPEGDVRDLAIRCAQELDLREQIPVIRSLVRVPNDVVRIAAIAALAEWHDDESRPMFLEATKSKVERLQNAGKAAISRLDSLERIIPKGKQTTENLISMLGDSRMQIRNQAAIALSRFGVDPQPALPALRQAIFKLDSTCTAAQIVVYLDLIRKMGPSAGSASDAILQMMNERAPIYQNRAKHEIYRLRAYMLLTLTDIGKAREGMLYIAEALANSDKYMVYNYAVAAHAAATLSVGAHGLEPLLERAMSNSFQDAPVSMGYYYAPLTPTTTTSARLEAIRAIKKIGPTASVAIPLLDELSLSDPNPKDKVPPWKIEAREVLALLKQ